MTTFGKLIKNMNSKYLSKIYRLKNIIIVLIFLFKSFDIDLYSQIINGSVIKNKALDEVADKISLKEKREETLYTTTTKGVVTFTSENLNTSTYKDGSPIAEAKSAEEWKLFNENKTPCYCHYNYDSKNANKLGKLYNYWAAINADKVIPEGWHIPNIYEIQIAFGVGDIPESEAFDINRRKHERDYLPNPIQIKLNGGVMPLAASACDKNGKFYGTPYAKNPEYVLWYGAWWINTEFKNKGLLAVKISAMIQTNSVDAEFISDNVGNGYSILCFKNTSEEKNESIMDTSKNTSSHYTEASADNSSNNVLGNILPAMPIEEKAERKKGIIIYQSKNLNTSVFRDGTIIPEAKSAEEWIHFNSMKLPAYCYYKFDSRNAKNTGKLYNYWAVASSKQIAPEGWHIPNKFELLKVAGSVEEIPDQTLKTNGNLIIGKEICDAYPKTITMYKSDGIIQLGGSYCSTDGKFYNTPYTERPDYVRWSGAWWTSNYSYNLYSKLTSPVILKVSSDIGGNAVQSDFENAKQGEGYSILCFKDYKTDPADSLEKLNQIPISKSLLSHKLKVIDSLIYAQNITTVSGLNKVFIYAMDTSVYADFLSLGNGYLNTYIKFGTLSEYYKNKKLRTLIDYSIQSGLFLADIPNIDWKKNKITTLDKKLPSDFREFDIMIDLSVLPTGFDYQLSIPELNINQLVTNNSTDLLRYNLDTSFIRSFNQLQFDKLTSNQATKKFTLSINCPPGKYFVGKNKIYNLNATKQNVWPEEKNNCYYTEVKSETVNLSSSLSINFIKINQVIHEIYKPTIDSLLLIGRFIEANDLFKNYLILCLPKYFNTPEENWPTIMLKHQPKFHENMMAKIYYLSKTPELFIKSFQLANAKNKLVIKKAYYRYGYISDTISKYLVYANSRTYNDYLISSLIQSTIGFSSFEKSGSDYDLFNYNSPILFNYRDLELPAAQFTAEPDIAAPLKLVNAAIGLQPANPIGYLYRSKFTGCKKYQMYHDACTVSDWCINCKDLQYAFKLDNNKTKTPPFEDELTIKGEVVSNNYYETFYILNCVECQLCFYNICGGGGKSKGVQTGNRGGKYYINSNGNKTYIK